MGDANLNTGQFGVKLLSLTLGMKFTKTQASLN